jgi:hypothetical protein
VIVSLSVILIYVDVLVCWLYVVNFFKFTDMHQFFSMATLGIDHALAKGRVVEVEGSSSSSLSCASIRGVSSLIGTSGEGLVSPNRSSNEDWKEHTVEKRS